MNFQRISVEEAKFKFFNDDGLPVEGVKILDIRDEGSFKEGHINNARHIDNTNFMDFLQSTEFDEPIIIYCYHGITSCLLYTSPSPRDAHESRMPSSA